MTKLRGASRWSLSTSCGAVLAAATLSGDALADEKQQCAAAYEQTQAFRKEGQLRKAREQAVVCAQDACPGVVKKDCAEWLPQIEASMPTVVFEARDASGQDTSEVRVSFDGAVLRERLDGKAVAVDPGQHTVRYETAGGEPIEERIVVREGEKNRKLFVSFAKSGSAGPAGDPGASADTGSDEGGIPTIAWVLGGVGIVGVGAFATFGLLGRSQKGDLEETCAPNCSEGDVDSVRTKLILADVSLGVGLVSLGVATYLIVTAPPKSAAASATRFDVAPTRGGAFATVGASF